MLATYAKAQYEEMQVQTTPEKLIVMLYDGVLRFLRMGVACMRNEDLAGQGVNLTKAQDILLYLDSTLNPDAGKLTVELRTIYRYCVQRVLYANAENRAEYVDEVIALLEPLREAWETAGLVSASERHGVPHPAFTGRAA
jgi:flagellar protein FliS